MDLSLLITANS